MLGSGLGDVCAGYPVEEAIGFEAMDGVGASDVAGHEGEVRRCIVGGKPCVFVLGRRHFYEGDVGAVEALMEFLVGWGVDSLLLTSAAGSLARDLNPGELMMVTDVVDLQFRPPTGVKPPAASQAREDSVLRERGTASAGMGKDLARLVAAAAKRAGVDLKRGVIGCTSGPAYETRAEVELLSRLGIDAVTMSAAPEMDIARRHGISASSLALITNLATGISPVRLDHAEVLETACEGVGEIRRIVEQLVDIIYT
jgi:purine-nucleoside phosphorylase